MELLLRHQHFSSSFPLSITELEQGPIAEHSHDFVEMVYVRQGKGVHFIGATAYPIQSGDLYVISPGESHYYAPLDGGQMRIVNILWMPELVEEMLHANVTLQGALQLIYVEPLLRSETRFAHRLHLSGRMAFRVEALIDEMRGEQTSNAAGSELLLRHLFCALLVLLSRAYDEQRTAAAKTRDSAGASTQHAVIAKAIGYIEAHYARPIRVADVAAHTAMSPSRLAHLFKAHTGAGLIEYLHQYRIARACSQLLENGDRVQEIATAAGYTDLRFFHRIFRRHAGCNPSQYRRHFGSAR